MSLASRAKPGQFQKVGFDAKPRFLADSLQKGREVASLKLVSGATIAADEVMMVAVAGQSIALTAIAAVDTTRQAHLCQKVQGAIYCHQADGWAEVFGPGMNRCRAGVSFVLSQRPDHGSPGACDPIACLAQLLEDALFSLNHS